MWITVHHWRALVHEPLSEAAVEARRYVARSIQELRDTPFVARSYKRSRLMSLCVTSAKLEFVRLEPPYDPDACCCFITKSRRWDKMRRLGDAVVHESVLPLLIAVHALSLPAADKWLRFRDMVAFVRRATKLFQQVSPGVAPRRVDAAEQAGQGVPRGLVGADLGRELAAQHGDAQALAAREAKAADVAGHDPPLSVQVVAPVVARVAVEKDHHVARKVRHRPAKNERVKGHPYAARHLDRDALVVGGAQA